MLEKIKGKEGIAQVNLKKLGKENEYGERGLSKIHLFDQVILEKKLWILMEKELLWGKVMTQNQ